jgi:hypothetical protein
MYRRIHIIVSLLAVVLLVRPFDCFAACAPDREAADCCLKGKCAPTAKSDECCKNSAPDSDQFVMSKTADQSSPLIALDATDIPSVMAAPTFQGLADPVTHPPPRAGLTAPSLPLLI